MRQHLQCLNPAKPGKSQVPAQLRAPGRSIPISRPKDATVKIQFLDNLALHSLSIVAGSPKGDGPAGQDSCLAVGPVRMAGVPSELRVQSSWVWFSEDPALKMLSTVAWTRWGTGPAGLDIKLSATSVCEEEAPSELWVWFVVDRLPDELAPTEPAFAVNESSQHAAPAENFCSVVTLLLDRERDPAWPVSVVDRLPSSWSRWRSSPRPESEWSQL